MLVGKGGVPESIWHRLEKKKMMVMLDALPRVKGYPAFVPPNQCL